MPEIKATDVSGARVSAKIIRREEASPVPIDTKIAETISETPSIEPGLAQGSTEIPTPTPTLEPEILGDPAPFDIESYVNEWNSGQPMGKAAENRDNIAKTLYHFAKPFFIDPLVEYGEDVQSANYNMTAALNRGIASFFAHLDGVAKFIEQNTGMKSEGLFEKFAEVTQKEGDYYKKQADEKGINFFDELVSEAIGGFVPGVSQFAIDVGSLYSFPYMDGYYRATTRNENPFVAGLLNAAKTKTLDALFKMMAPLKTYLKAPSFGTVFGFQEMEGAPEGQKGKAFVKGAAIGAGYALTSPGGRMGLNEVAKNFEEAYPKFMEKMQD